MHLHNLFGDGKPEAGPALGLGVGAVDLVELCEDARLLLWRNARSRIAYADGEATVRRHRTYAHLTGVREFQRIADQIEQHLPQTLLIPKPQRHALGDFGLEGELFASGKWLGCRAHGFHHAFERVFADV